MKKYYQKQWAMSLLLNILINKDNTKEEIYNNCYKMIMTEEYNNIKYDLSNLLELDFKDIFLKKNKNIRLESIEYITNNFLGYFRTELEEYKENNHFYDLSDNKFKITESWKKDKVIMELVHIYKIFDFQNQNLIIYGY